MGEPPFAPAITGPIEDPRHLRPDVASELFDEKTRERLKRLAGALRFSAVELIREGTLRYLDELEMSDAEQPDSPSSHAITHHNSIFTPDSPTVGPDSSQRLK